MRVKNNLHIYIQMFTYLNSTLFLKHLAILKMLDVWHREGRHSGLLLGTSSL